MPDGQATLHLPFAGGPDSESPADDGPSGFTNQDELAPPLWSNDEGQQLTRRWERAQDAFIDTPREAGPEIDSLVALVATRMAEMFAAERGRLEGQWERGDEVTPEDLRVALLRYRAFFGQLLAT
jgi:hypothetical protein